MKRVSIPGLVVAALYIASAIVIVVLDRTAPLAFSSGFRSFAVALLGIQFHVSDNAAMACAILFCAVLCYLLGWFIAKAIWFLRTAS